MKTDDFEKRVQRQTLRQVPAEWREDILSAARQASSPEHATRNTQHASPWRSVLSTLNAQLSTLLWPRPAAWAGLAAVWVMVLALHPFLEIFSLHLVIFRQSPITNSPYLVIERTQPLAQFV